MGGSYYYRKVETFLTGDPCLLGTITVITKILSDYLEELTQKFGSEESNDENSASVKNAFITIQGDYTNKYIHL